MNLQLPKIYPITDARLSGLPHAAQVEKLIDGGAEIIQLREKYLSPREFYDAAAEALSIARRRGAKVIINDRVDIALALKADGVHLGQDDLPPEKARKILGDLAIIGFSTHTIEQARRAVKLPIDYLAIGPVFKTQTKENPDETVGLKLLEKLRGQIGDFPLVAIGGINLENFRAVLSHGADSAAIIGDLVGRGEHITEQFQMFSKFC